MFLSIGALACGGNGANEAATPVPPEPTPPVATAVRTVPAPTELPEPTLAPSVMPHAPAPASPPVVPTREPTAAAPPATAASSPAGQALTVVAEGAIFIPSALTAAPGAVTVTLDNRDTGVPHDLQFYGPANAPAGSTAVIVGPAVASVTLDVAAGSYRFVCTVHPLQMRGVLTVD